MDDKEIFDVVLKLYEELKNVIKKQRVKTPAMTKFLMSQHVITLWWVGEETRPN
jgi:hypothetical protein